MTPEREAWVMATLERVADREVPDDQLPGYMAGYVAGLAAARSDEHQDDPLV